MQTAKSTRIKTNGISDCGILRFPSATFAAILRTLDRKEKFMTKRNFVLGILPTLMAVPLLAQPPIFAPGELERVVSRVALYPDPLLAQVMAAATYSDQIPDAAQWSDQHHYLTGDQLASAISGDQLPWDPSVQALLPFPNVLDMMANDMGWTQQLGNAFLEQRQDVMEAVQRDRRKARDFGYLRSNGQIIVGGGPYVTIAPANPNYIVLPYYDPAVVFYAPRPGFFVGNAIGFRFGVTIGPAFRPWGWGYNRFDWDRNAMFINNSAWGRNWGNRGAYVHPYEGVRRFAPDYRRPAEEHRLHERSEREREAFRGGRGRVEEHRGGRDR
jgi:hypothetical protein